MAKKRETDPPPTEPTMSHGDNGDEKKHPLISWRVHSDRTTSIELAIWSNTIQGQHGEFEQLSMTIVRSFKTDQGWNRGGSYRAHDLPVLGYLLSKAYAFALDRRMQESGVPF